MIGRYTEKTSKFRKKGFPPLSQGMQECVRLAPKNWDTDACNLRHWLVQFRFCTRTPSEIQDLYKSVSIPYSQPLFTSVNFGLFKKGQVPFFLSPARSVRKCNKNNNLTSEHKQEVTLDTNWQPAIKFVSKTVNLDFLSFQWQYHKSCNWESNHLIEICPDNHFLHIKLP